MSNFYTPREVSEILNVSDVCLHLWRRDGIGPPWRKQSYRIFYPANTFKEYLDRIGAVPANMTPREKGQFFKRAHGATIKPHKTRAKTAKPRKTPARVTIRLDVSPACVQPFYGVPKVNQEAPFCRVSEFGGFRGDNFIGDVERKHGRFLLSGFRKRQPVTGESKTQLVAIFRLFQIREVGESLAVGQLQSVVHYPDSRRKLGIPIAGRVGAKMARYPDIDGLIVCIALGQDSQEASAHGVGTDGDSDM